MDDKEHGLDILTLIDDEGVEHEFEIADTMEMGDQMYIALIPLLSAEETADDADELVVLKVVEENGAELLEPIENEEEFERVADAFMLRLEETFDFIAEDQTDTKPQ